MDSSLSRHCAGLKGCQVCWRMEPDRWLHIPHSQRKTYVTGPDIRSQPGSDSSNRRNYQSPNVQSQARTRCRISLALGDGVVRTRSSRIAQHPKFRFPHSLCRGSERLVIDEAQTVKNDETQSWTAVSWLEPRHTHAVTATLLHNRFHDFKGILQLIEPLGLWEEANLARLGVDKNVKPFALPPNHLGQYLCHSSQALHRFVFPEGNSRENQSIIHIGK